MGIFRGCYQATCTARLAYINGYKTIHIASSFTAKYRPICASDPYTENCFRVGNSKAHHDGFDYDYSKPSVRMRFDIIKENCDATYGDNYPEDIKWLKSFNPNFVRNTPYWIAKRNYRKLKSLVKKK